MKERKGGKDEKSVLKEDESKMSLQRIFLQNEIKGG